MFPFCFWCMFEFSIWQGRVSCPSPVVSSALYMLERVKRSRDTDDHRNSKAHMSECRELPLPVLTTG